MKKQFTLYTIMAALIASSILPITAMAQTQKSLGEYYGRPSYWNPYDQRGINRFETSKVPDSIPFEGPRIRIGAGFAQSFQNLKHETKSNVGLVQIGPGFNLAMANLFLDFQLADGIRLNLTNYMSTRHHNEFWVKGGYIQFDKLPFKGKFFSDIMEIATIKIGHMEVNYGDQHFRRSDGGHTMMNPFVENLIADAFSTEIGGEIYLQKNGLFGMVGMTNGTINSSIGKQARDADMDSSKNPAIYLKAGYDKKLTNQLRVRVSGSAYINNRSQRNVLYGGDRSGSHYWSVLESAAAPANFSGRFNPGFTRNIQAVMLNGFVKYAGLEVFGTYETTKGNAANELTKRNMNQIAIDGLYRFGAKENVYVGARYNKVEADMLNNPNKVNIDRVAFAGGWFLTPSVLLKAEYVTQKYNNFMPTDIRNGGKFNGYVIEAVVGF